MGLITDLIKNGVLNKSIDRKIVKISKEQQQKLRNGETILVEETSDKVIVKIKDKSLNKSDLKNEDFDIRQI